MSLGNMSKLVKQAQKLQAQMVKLQEELASRTVEASAGGGAVQVVVSGGQEIKSVRISPEIVSADDVEMLEDVIMAAVNEGLKKAREMVAEEMSKLTGISGMPGLF